MFQRPTTLAGAFVAAAAKQMHAGKVDHQAGKGSWVARKVLLNTERVGFAVITEYDKSPKKPKNTLDAAAIKGINEGIEELVELGMMERHAPVAGIVV